MNGVIIRDIEINDMKQIRVIVNDVWDFSEFMGCEKTADAAVGVYLSQVLENSSFGRVAVLDGEVVGVIFGALKGQEPTCRMLQGNYINDVLTLMQASDDVREDFAYYIQTINDTYAELIQDKMDDYDGTLDFFIVAKKAQGLKVGKKLWNHLADYFKTHQAEKIYVYTDTNCNFGFYDYNGFDRIGVKDLIMEFDGGEEELGVYLYDYSFNQAESIMTNFKPGTRIMLDPIGQFYASIISSNFPGNYTISATLKESVNPEILQQAVNDLFKRLPFLNGRLHEAEFGYEHEILADPPKVTLDQGLTPFETFYHQGQGHVIRVVYGDFHFKVEAIHSMIDGRSTTEITKALLVRYFKLAGVEVEPSSVINCDDKVTAEEGEDASERFADLKEKQGAEVEDEEIEEAYLHEGSTPSPTQVKTLHFDLATLKEAAKSYGTTLNGYLLGHLFEVIAEERETRQSQKPISILAPIDFRRFFPTKTLRNFVSGTTISMPEVNDFSEMVKQIQVQFEGVDKAYIQKEINDMQALTEAYRNTPQVEKKQIWEGMAESYNKMATTTFSNIGLVKLPPSVESRVVSMEFAISQEGRPYSFGCISVGNTLTLTITSSVEGDYIADQLKARLEKAE